MKTAIALESRIGDFNLLRYIHRSVILITSSQDCLFDDDDDDAAAELVG